MIVTRSEACERTNINSSYSKRGIKSRMQEMIYMIGWKSLELVSKLIPNLSVMVCLAS